MSKEENNRVLPKLRFEEFLESGEWVEKVLGFVSDVRDGTHDSPKFVSEGKSLLTSKNLLSNGTLDFKNVNLISEDDYTQINKRSKVNIGDILFGMIGTIGNPVFVKYEGFAIKNVALIKEKKELLNRYLIHFLNSDYLIYQFKILMKGNAQKFIALGVIRGIKIYIPDKREQQKIADCLSSLDDLITAQNQKLEALKAHKTGLMQQLFPAEGETVPKLRFGEFRNSGEWEEKTIGDFIESYKGGAPLAPADFTEKSGYEVIPKKSVIDGGWLNLNELSPTYCTEKFYNENLQSVIGSEYLITTLRDLVPSGPSIGFIVRYKGAKKYILAQGVYGLKPKKSIIPVFLIHFSNTILYRKLVNAVMVGSTQVHIRNGDFLALPIKLPSLNEQQKIADCLSSLDDFIASQTLKMGELKIQKKAMMQQLFPIIA